MVRQVRPPSDYKIVIIDDDVDMLLYLRVIAEQVGYQVLTANNGNEGLQIIHTERPDLIVCDVMMPPPNGFDLRKMLNEDPELADIPFIFLTGRRAGADKQFALIGLLADDYITKPCERKDFLARLEKALHKDEML